MARIADIRGRDPAQLALYPAGHLRRSIGPTIEALHILEIEDAITRESAAELDLALVELLRESLWARLIAGDGDGGCEVCAGRITRDRDARRIDAISDAALFGPGERLGDIDEGIGEEMLRAESIVRHHDLISARGKDIAHD